MTLQARWEKAISEWQAAGLHPDEKALADALPAVDPEATLAAWAAKPKDLEAFVHTYLYFTEMGELTFKPDPQRSPEDHIRALWPSLTRHADPLGWQGTRLPLTKPYVVPGGRFQELYYWDSYFTMLGLAVHGEKKALLHMLDNFAELISSHGHIPNGTRTYFLSRSQPPYFSLMVRLAVEQGWTSWKDYAKPMRLEYQFWMEGAEHLTANGQCHRRVVRCGGYTVNRYWDDSDAPRLEMSAADRLLAASSERPERDLYRNIRAACESGWDFSSRWLKNPRLLSSLETTEIVPVDLNSLLLCLEWSLAQAFPSEHLYWMDCYRTRKRSLQTLFWDGQTFVDVNMDGTARSGHRSAAMLYPLWAGAGKKKQVVATLDWVRVHLLGPGGVSTTNVDSGQQWDAPNAWAPLQWTAIAGTARCGYPDLAQTMAETWIHSCESVYAVKTALVEKYDAYHPEDPAKGGEYALQDGFGWTNGVYLAANHYLTSGKLVGF